MVVAWRQLLPVETAAEVDVVAEVVRVVALTTAEVEAVLKTLVELPLKTVTHNINCEGKRLR